jgi:hypothetical protein
VFFVAAFARADFILATSIGQEGGIVGGEIRVVVEFTTDLSWGTDPVTPLFDETISLADVGKTFAVNDSTPFFSQNIALAADGHNNRVGFSLLQKDGSGGGSVFFEAEFFFGAPHSPFYLGKADLKGYSIKRVTLRIDEFTIIPSPPNPWNDYSFKATVSFFEDATPRDTPEPASCCLALLGAMGIAAARRFQRASRNCHSPGTDSLFRLW